MPTRPQVPKNVPEPETGRPVALIAALLVLAVAIALAVWRLQPPAAKSVDAPQDQFSSGRAWAVLQELLAEGVPHPSGSPANDLIQERIVSNLQALGYQVEVQDATPCWQASGAIAVCSRVKNILTRLPGQVDGPAVMLVSHYDSAAAGPGVADAGASVAAILEIARILKQQGPLHNPVILLLTDGEEDVSMGAWAFVDDHPWAKDVGAVVNLEGRGTSGRSLMFETSTNNAWLIKAYASAVPHPATNSLMVEAYRALSSGTDLSVFMEAGMPGLNLAFTNDSSRYHTPLDSLQNLDPRSLQHQGETALAVVSALAARDLANPPAGDEAYVDLLGLVVLRWPAEWSSPLAMLAGGLLLAASFGLIRRQRLTAQALLWGILAAFLSLILALVLGLLLTWLLRLMTSAYEPWRAYPLPTRLALWVGVLLVTVAVGARLAKRAGWWGLGLGVWLVWVLMAVLLNALMPGAAILFLVPALCAAVLLALVAFVPLPAGASIPAVEAALIIPAFVAALIWPQSALYFESVAGLGSSAVLAPMVALVAITLLPFLALSPERVVVRTWLLGGAAVVTVVAVVVAALLPISTPSRPQAVNLYHYEDRDKGVAYRVALPWSENPPASLSEQFNLQSTAIFPWTSGEFLAAPTSPLSETVAPPPDLEILSDEPSNGGRVVQAQLRSARKPREFDLRIPIVGLASVSASGNSFTVDPADASEGYYTFFCFGPSCDGLDVTLQFTSTNQVSVFVVDRSSGLPPDDVSFSQARPAMAVPIHDGDQTMVLRRVDF